MEDTKLLMLAKLKGNEELAAKLIPDWDIGCRRATPGLSYLEALTQSHVSLVQEPILMVNPSGIRTVNGRFEEFGFEEFDAIVCATGFDVTYRLQFPLCGCKGIDLAEKWKEEPLAYLSICAPGFPNYISKWMLKFAEEGTKWVDVKEDVTQELNAYGDQIMQSLVWGSNCKSWYKNNNPNGRVTALWAGSGLGFREMVSDLRPEDFLILYQRSNRFRFMGNGRTKKEFEPEADLAWFMDNC